MTAFDESLVIGKRRDKSNSPQRFGASVTKKKNEYWKPSARNQEKEINYGVQMMSSIGVCCVINISKPPPQ